MTSLHDFSATAIDGKPIELSSYDGKVVLVVNTASKCGLTPQFEGLQQLYDEYGDSGFTVLGFPCDQFANQELDADDAIADFCQKNYGVTFPMFSKIDVNGDETHPVYQWLKAQKGGLGTDGIKWNFTKFLVGKDGQVIDRYAPTTKPSKISKDIKKALA